MVNIKLCNSRECSVKNVLSSSLLPRNVKIEVGRAVISRVFLNRVAVQVTSSDENMLRAVTDIRRRQYGWCCIVVFDVFNVAKCCDLKRSSLGFWYRICKMKCLQF